ncbi:MAG: response regulator transcription factor [Comamonas sp.]
MSAGNLAGSQGPTIVVAVSHRYPLVQAGLQAGLMYEREFAVSIVSPSNLSLRAHADVVITDYETALELFAALVPQAPGQGARTARVMVVSHRDRETDIRNALSLGVLGYLLLGCAVEDMICGVRALSRGQLHLDRSVAQRLAEGLGRQALTQREIDVLGCITEGRANKAIANELGITAGTVKVHVKAIFSKLGTRTRTEAAAVARRRGLTSTAV